jgi:hypothetical protein
MTYAKTLIASIVAAVVAAAMSLAFVRLIAQVMREFTKLLDESSRRQADLIQTTSRTAAETIARIANGQYQHPKAEQADTAGEVEVLNLPWWDRPSSSIGFIDPSDEAFPEPARTPGVATSVPAGMFEANADVNPIEAVLEGRIDPPRGVSALTVRETY